MVGQPCCSRSVLKQRGSGRDFQLQYGNARTAQQRAQMGRRIGIQPTGEIGGIVAHRQVTEREHREKHRPDNRPYGDASVHLAETVGVWPGLKAACRCCTIEMVSVAIIVSFVVVDLRESASSGRTAPDMIHTTTHTTPSFQDEATDAASIRRHCVGVVCNRVWRSGTETARLGTGEHSIGQTLDGAMRVGGGHRLLLADGIHSRRSDA